MAQVLCTRHFLAAQDMYMPTKMIYYTQKNEIPPEAGEPGTLIYNISS